MKNHKINSSFVIPSGPKALTNKTYTNINAPQMLFLLDFAFWLYVILDTDYNLDWTE